MITIKSLNPIIILIFLWLLHLAESQKLRPRRSPQEEGAQLEFGGNVDVLHMVLHSNEINEINTERAKPSTAVQTLGTHIYPVLKIKVPEELQKFPIIGKYGSNVINV